MGPCIFCNYQNDENQTVMFENELCVCLLNPEQRILEGSCVIVPKAHKITVFDLDEQEWEASKQLLNEVKLYLDAKYNPDGYNVGWNCGEIGGQVVFHAHMHVIPRYADEPYAGRGIRNLIKREENLRPSKLQ